jgi:hypothetical protein
MAWALPRRWVQRRLLLAVLVLVVVAPVELLQEAVEREGEVGEGGQVRVEGPGRAGPPFSEKP